MIAMMGTTSYMPACIQIAKSLGATLSGYVLAAPLAGMMILSTVSGVWASKMDRIKWMPATGALIAAASCLAISLLDADLRLPCGYPCRSGSVRLGDSRAKARRNQRRIGPLRDRQINKGTEARPDEHTSVPSYAHRDVKRQ